MTQASDPALRAQFEAVVDEVCARVGAARERSEIIVPLEGGREQHVELDYFEFDEEELVRVFTYIGDADAIDPLRLTHALRLNFGLAHGSIALRGEKLVLVDTLLVEDPHADEIEASVMYLAETADQFERTLFGGDEY